MRRFKFIGPYLIPGEVVPTIDQIQRSVAAKFDVPLRHMRSDARNREVARPRQVAMYLSRTRTGRTLQEIGNQFGKRDHTTVLHAVRHIAHLRQIDSGLSAAIRDVEAGL